MPSFSRSASAAPYSRAARVCWPLLRAGLSVRAVIGHGVGDPRWAEQAAREMADLESRYNRAKE